MAYIFKLIACGYESFRAAAHLPDCPDLTLENIEKVVPLIRDEKTNEPLEITDGVVDGRGVTAPRLVKAIEKNDDMPEGSYSYWFSRVEVAAKEFRAFNKVKAKNAKNASKTKTTARTAKRAPEDLTDEEREKKRVKGEQMALKKKATREKVAAYEEITEKYGNKNDVLRKLEAHDQLEADLKETRAANEQLEADLKKARAANATLEKKLQLTAPTAGDDDSETEDEAGDEGKRTEGNDSDSAHANSDSESYSSESESSSEFSSSSLSSSEFSSSSSSSSSSSESSESEFA